MPDEEATENDRLIGGGTKQEEQEQQWQGPITASSSSYSSRNQILLGWILLSTSIAVVVIGGALDFGAWLSLERHRRHDDDNMNAVRRGSMPPSSEQKDGGGGGSEYYYRWEDAGDVMWLDDDLQRQQKQEFAMRDAQYKATQFISFTINTLGGLESAGDCAGRNNNVDPGSGLCYLGYQNLTRDVFGRLEVLKQVLSLLKKDMFSEEPEVDINESVLKIFMMPEFFMRGPDGAYPIEELIDSDDDSKDGLLVQWSDAVDEILYDETFKDFLFVMGTLVVVAPKDNDTNPDVGFGQADSSTSASEFIYYNFAPVFRAGREGYRKRNYMLQKRYKYISSADFLSRATLPNPSNEDLHYYGDADNLELLRDTFYKRNVTLVDDNLIDLDGIRIGIEICLDHRMGSFWQAVQTRHHSQLADVLLISSAGMSIERGPNPVKPGGVVYLSDGEASSAACLRTDEGVFDPMRVCRVKPDGLQHLRPFGGPGYSNFFALSGCIDLANIDLLEGLYSMHQPQGCANTLKMYGINVYDEFKLYPPSLEIYPTVSLPVAD